MNRKIKSGIYIQWNIIQPLKGMNSDTWYNMNES